MHYQTPLSSLAPGPDPIMQASYPPAQAAMQGCYPQTQRAMYEQRSYGGGNWAWAIIVFIIIVIIIWLLLWAFKPTWVQKTTPSGRPTGEVDNGKAFLWAVVIAIIIVIIIWIIRAAAAW